MKVDEVELADDQLLGRFRIVDLELGVPARRRLVERHFFSNLLVVDAPENCFRASPRLGEHVLQLHFEYPTETADG